MGQRAQVGRAGLFFTQEYAKTEEQMRAVVVVLGQDRPGIIAKILDINQTVLQGDLFSMVLLADMDKLNAPFDQLKDALCACASQLGVDIQVQREEIFQSMHRI